MSLFSELRRRNVYRVAGLYIIDQLEIAYQQRNSQPHDLTEGVISMPCATISAFRPC